MNTPPPPNPARPRFIEILGGGIFDTVTGKQLARVSVENLSSLQAREIANIIIAALTVHFPQPQEKAQ